MMCRQAGWIGILFLAEILVGTSLATWAQEAAPATPAAETTPAANPPADTATTDASAPAAEKAAEAAAPATEPAAEPVEVRLVALSGTYVDLVQPIGLDPTSLLLGGSPARQKSFYRLCTYLDELAAEEELKYVVFDLSDASLSFNPAQLDELARHLKKLNDAGKKTIAWLEQAGNEHLEVAAACGRIVMADFGGIDMPSVSMQSLFYRDAMDLVGVKASIVRAGDFKGAVEPYMNPVMSEHLRLHYLEMLKTVNDARVSRIAAGRGLKTEQVRTLQARRILLPNDALAAGLVDQLAPYGSLQTTIDELIGEKTNWTTRKAKAKKEVSFFELMGMLMSGPANSSSRIRDDSLAVLHLSGPIMDGTTASAGSIISGPTIKVIETLRKEEKIKGVVVRINSPGGSATASEAIRQALAKLAKEKPTVVSMGEMAASGGYWISCIDVPVYAERGTVTGSIGVFSMKLSFGSLLRRVGVHVESITLDESAAFTAFDRSWSEEDVARLQGTIDHVYDRFLKLVAESRGKSLEEVGTLAGGRVWSGTQAKLNGLIDEIGGVDDCLAVVAKKADLKEYKVLHRPESSGGLNLAELFGPPDDDSVELSDLSRNLMAMLRQRGFHWGATSAILRDAVANGGRQRPTVWLLNPAEISMR